MRILLVGCGKMGGAMRKRWEDLYMYTDIQVIDPEFGLPDISALPADFSPDVIVFAVKPQTLPDMIGDYKPLMANGPLVISIIAGKSISFFEEHLGKQAKVVRSMPNTPAAIGKGITAACPNAQVSADEKAKAEKLLSAVGNVVWVSREELLNPVTALSGSGPAYVFLLIETLAKAGMKIGLDERTANRLARQTVIGSAALAETANALSPEALRENVTSKGGTTAAALDVLMADDGIQQLFDRALEAANKRAKELAG